MKKRKSLVTIIVVVFIILGILVFVDISELIGKCTYLATLKNNLFWLERVLDTFTPLFVLILIMIFIVWAKTNLSITITSCSVGGVEVSLRDIEGEVKYNVKNFLNTKRSLFKIYPEYDNFYDVFASYYDIYEFLRSQLMLFTSSNKQDSNIYKALQDMLKELNCFLTKYQSDYRRWYENEIEKEFVPLSELQKSYTKYDEIVKAFVELNYKMNSRAEIFGVDTFLLDDLSL